MTSVVRFEEWQEPTGTTAATTDSSGNVTFNNDVTVSGDLTVTGNMTSANQGLVFIKSQTIGSGVSSVTVTDAFSGDFDNYRIMVQVDGTSASPYLRLQLGTTTTGYYGARVAATYLGNFSAGAGNNNSAHFGFLAASYLGSPSSFSADIRSPHLATETHIFSSYVDSNATSGASAGTYSGFLNNSTSYDDFTILVSTGTMSGGTIRVYGYSNGG